MITRRNAENPAYSKKILEQKESGAAELDDDDVEESILPDLIADIHDDEKY